MTAVTGTKPLPASASEPNLSKMTRIGARPEVDTTRASRNSRRGSPSFPWRRNCCRCPGKSVACSGLLFISRPDAKTFGWPCRMSRSTTPPSCSDHSFNKTVASPSECLMQAWTASRQQTQSWRATNCGIVTRRLCRQRLSASPGLVNCLLHAVAFGGIVPCHGKHPSRFVPSSRLAHRAAPAHGDLLHQGRDDHCRVRGSANDQFRKRSAAAVHLALHRSCRRGARTVVVLAHARRIGNLNSG